jgi:cellobiose phosphorylase
MKNSDLLYYNDFGGFSKDGKEYVLKTSEKYTPLPWSHIIANENFGTIVTSSGGGYIWSGNSRENKILLQRDIGYKRNWFLYGFMCDRKRNFV